MNIGNGNRRSLQMLAAALGALCAAGTCIANGVADHCIVGDNAIGCRSERMIDLVTAYHGNPDALRDTIESSVTSGMCQLFFYGEHVYLTRTDGTMGNERSVIRRPSDGQTYWMPASWSRPADECAPDLSPRTMDRKLGLAAHEPAEPGQNGEMPAAQPQTIARGMPQQERPAGCMIKPVMSDAEIAGCRDARPVNVSR